MLYIDAFSGASGDMILGALLDLGIPREPWEEEIRKLPLGGLDIRVQRKGRHGIHGTQVQVEAEGGHPHRTMRDIRALLDGSPLTARVRELSLRIFDRLARAEGQIHDVPPEEVSFHEVGALDSIVDVVGASAGIHLLRPTRIMASPLPLGEGFVQGRHGVLPVPAPATLEILRGVPVRHGGVKAELVTPTGAAILREVVQAFDALPPMRVTQIGYGVGSRDLPDRPNLLRFLLGEEEATGSIFREDWVLEANVDDMNPEFCEHLMDRLLSRGALDVTWTHLTMKKGRPGGLLRVLAEPGQREALMEIILRESTTIGVRFYPVRRQCLEREHQVVETRWGPVRIKVSRLKDEVLNALPEYEDCRALANKTGLPLKEIYQQALSVYGRQGARP